MDGEKRAIDAVAYPATRESLAEALRAVGFGGERPILMHSSLSRLGWVCGGAQAVVLALLDALGERGTLILPAHSGQLSDPALWVEPPVPKDWIDTIRSTMPAYDPLLTPTRQMGSIVELFRVMPGVRRSMHPTVSFCGYGPLAEAILARHELGHELDWDSPLGRLYERDAQVVLLGVGFENATCLHLSESRLPRMDTEKQGSPVRDADGRRVWRWYTQLAYDSDDFGLLGRAFQETGAVHTGSIANAECRWFSLREAVDFGVEWMQAHRLFT